MPPNRARPAQPEADEPEQLTLDPYTFTAPERLEVQVQFDTAYGDLLDYIRQSWNPNREGPMTSAIVARDGTRWFPDQIIAFMLWVQERRSRPDAQLSEFDNLTLAELTGAHVRGLLRGKATTTSRSTRSSKSPASSGSSEAG